jgi:hypothetical protein
MATLTNTDAVIVELYENPLTERKDDRYGRVVNIASVNEETLVERAIQNGFNGNAASMKAAAEAVKLEALKAIVRGELVTYGLAHIALDVEGAFIGDTPSWDPAANKLAARIAPTKALRETLKATPVRILGMAPDGSAIASVTDVATGKVNETLTLGGMANIKGTRIKIAGDNAGNGLFLTNEDTKEAAQIPSTAIGANDPSKIAFVVPATLAKGSYRLSVVTQYSGSGKLLKEPRTIALQYVLAVE